MSKQTRKEIESILAKRESKKQRVQLLLEPSIYDFVRDVAWKNRTSSNKLIRDAVVNYLMTFESEKSEKSGKWEHINTRKCLFPDNATEQFRVTKDPFRYIRTLQCSNCGMWTSLDDTIIYKYCPHCGAIMEV